MLSVISTRSTFPPKEKSETGDVSFSAFQPNLSMDNYNEAQSQILSSNNQCLLKIKPGKDYHRCIWCINHSLQQETKESIDCNLTRERTIPSSLGPEWKCDSNSRTLGVQESCEDECLDFFMQISLLSLEQSHYDQGKKAAENGYDAAMNNLAYVMKMENEQKRI